MREIFRPMGAPILAKNAFHLRSQPGLDRADGLGGGFVKFQRLNMLIEVTGAGRTATERMHFGMGQTIKVVELHRGQRRTKLLQLRRWLIEFSTLVVWADYKNAHVMVSRRQD